MRGFIYSVECPHLVLGVTDTDNSLIEVILMKKNVENSLQRWVYTDTGSFVLKCRQNLALTVKIPPFENVDLSLTRKDNMDFLSSAPIVNESPLILQSLIETENGNANQKWFVEENVGLIFAFAPKYDKSYGKLRLCLLSKVTK